MNCLPDLFFITAERVLPADTVIVLKNLEVVAENERHQDYLDFRRAFTSTKLVSTGTKVTKQR